MPIAGRVVIRADSTDVVLGVRPSMVPHYARLQQVIHEFAWHCSTKLKNHALNSVRV